MEGSEAKNHLADELGHRIAAAIKTDKLHPDKVEALLAEAETKGTNVPPALDTSGTRKAVSSAVSEDKPPDISMDDLVASTARESWIHIGEDIYAVPYPRDNPQFYYIIPSPGLHGVRCYGLKKFYQDLDLDSYINEWKFTRTAWVQARSIEFIKKQGKLAAAAVYRLDALMVSPGLGKAERIK